MNKKIIYNQVGFFGSSILSQVIQDEFLGVFWGIIGFLYGIRLVYLLFKKINLL